MFDNRQKYIRFGEYNSFLFFPTIIDHKVFKHLNPISAGFCYLDQVNVVYCFGESVSLELQSMEDDTKLATKQVYGIDAMLNLK
jgi:hypothetical protein